ncbi:MAG: hypothetical protein DI592_24290, partial [Stenotrophomonas maltophilia]
MRPGQPSRQLAGRPCVFSGPSDVLYTGVQKAVAIGSEQGGRLAVASAPEDPDQAVPAHLGDPGREQAALAEGRAVCALARDVVTVTGPDRLSWLTTLSSQVLTGLEPGDGGAETLLLDAQGHITHALAALDDG